MCEVVLPVIEVSPAFMRSLYHESGREDLSTIGSSEQFLQEGWLISSLRSLRQANKSDITATQSVFHVILLL